MKRKQKPTFYAWYKNVNTGQLVPIDVLSYLWDEILTTKNKLRKEYANNPGPIVSTLMWNFWSKCEWEFIISDWPPISEEVRKMRQNLRYTYEIKMDVWDQIRPNIPLILSLIYNYTGQELPPLTLLDRYGEKEYLLKPLEY